jgi:hypothetical protein
MLSQIVRPMVSTQIRLLANSKATRVTLITTIAKWLSFLGVRAKVTNLDARGEQIQVSLTVGKPEACDRTDWEKILGNLNHDRETIENDPLQAEESVLIPISISPQSETKFQRILAYVIQMGNPDEPTDWDVIYPQLKSLGFEESRLLGIKSALKVPQSIDRLVKDLDADVAAIALAQAASIAMLDRKVNHQEHQVMQSLLKAMQENC